MATNSGKKRRGPGKPFKPGQTGNPRGRPPGPGLLKLLIEALGRKAENGKTYAELLVLRVVQKAVVEGDDKMIEFLWDKIEGKTPQPLDLKFTLGLGKEDAE